MLTPALWEVTDRTAYTNGAVAPAPFQAVRYKPVENLPAHVLSPHQSIAKGTIFLCHQKAPAIKQFPVTIKRCAVEKKINPKATHCLQRKAILISG